MSDAFGHTPFDKAVLQGDVYGVAHDARRAARERVRLGIVGMGGVAQTKYLPALARLTAIWEPVDVVAFVEPRDDQAEKIGGLYRFHRHAAVERMLAEEDLHGVLVLSPDELHFEHASACLEAGRHALVEKPVCRSLVEAERLCRIAEETGRILMTVANKRFAPPYAKAKAILDAGALAEPALFSAKFNLGYRYVDLLEGGTVHLFDLSRFLMGDVAELSALGVNRYGLNVRRYPFDNAAIRLAFGSGAIGSIVTIASALNFKPWERVEVYGREAWLAVDDQAELELYRDDKGPAERWRPVMANTLLLDEEFGGYAGLIENFLQAIRGRAAPGVTGRDGYLALELVAATHLSLAARHPVSLPLDAEAADREVRAWLAWNGWPGAAAAGASS